MRPARPGARADLRLRSLHRIAALFLAPWVLMYALSTLAMNHRESWEGSGSARVFGLLRDLHKNDAFEAGTFSALGWSLAVNLFAFAMLFWLASGLWMWWRMPPTRRRGWISQVIGIALFAFFLIRI